MLGKTLLIGSLVAAIILVVMLNQTTPSQAGPLGVLAFFVCSYIISVTMASFVIYGVSRAVAKLASGVTIKRPLRPLVLKRAYYFASIIGAAPVMLLALQSVGGIGFYELLLVFVFVIIGCVYIGRKVT